MPVVLIERDTVPTTMLGRSILGRGEISLRYVASRNELIETAHSTRPDLIVLALAPTTGTGASQEIMQTAARLDGLPVIAFGEPIPATLPPLWTAPGAPRIDRLESSVARLLGASARQAPRRPTRLAAELFHGGGVETGHVRDLSSDGLRLTSSRALPAGAPVQLLFDLPGPAGVRIRAEAEVVREVVHGDPAGFGLRFVKLGRRDRLEISSFVAAGRQPSPGSPGPPASDRP